MAQPQPAQPVQTQPQPAQSSVGWDTATAQKLAFKEYQLLMEGTDKITDRRQTVNTLFVSINALFLTGVGYLLLQSFQNIARSFWFMVGFFFIAILMTVINKTWLDLSESNRRLVDLRIRYMKQLEKHLREASAAASTSSGAFPTVVTPLKDDEVRADGQHTETTRGTYTLEDVLYNPDAKHQPLGFSRAEQRIGRTFTTAYWLAFALAVVAFLLVVVGPLVGLNLPAPL